MPTLYNGRGIFQDNPEEVHGLKSFKFTQPKIKQETVRIISYYFETIRHRIYSLVLQTVAVAIYNDNVSLPWQKMAAQNISNRA